MEGVCWQRAWRSDPGWCAQIHACCSVQVSIPGGGNISVKDYLDQNFNYRITFIGPVFGILCTFMVFFGALAILSLKMINYQRR